VLSHWIEKTDGWGRPFFCLLFRRMPPLVVIPARARIHFPRRDSGGNPTLVIPAKPGSILLCLSSSALLRKPTHVPCEFRPPSWRPSYFLLLAQKKVTKEKGTLAVAVARASMPLRLREQAAGFA
jgi:hypothetical protein